MKYKLISIVIIIALVFLGLFLDSYYDKELSYVYHQHIEDSSDEFLCDGISNCSHLPIVNINTNNQAIPGEDKDKSKYIISDINIYDNGNDVNTLGVDGYSIKARLRYRGRSSLYFDKKGYLIRFVDDDNKKISEEFLGMPADNQWVLHGPFIDKTLIRNYMWYNISQEIMGAAPKTRLLELYVDNEYMGVYLAAESVTQSSSSRVKISSINKDSIATSYLIQLDAELGNEITSLNSFSNYTFKLRYNIESELGYVIKYPEDEDISEDVKKYIYDDFNEFEKMLYSFDYKEYKDYIDVDSFVDYFIINEFTQNYDAGYLSTYIYKDVFGKYKMYVWDFNSANNNYETDFLEQQFFEFQNNVWFEPLIRDEEFVEAVISRYEELRNSYLSEEYLYNYIDGTVSYLGDAIDRNFEVWGYTFEPDYYAFVTSYMPIDYEDAIAQLKDAIHKRGEWMDKNIYTLRQYCHPSKTKKYNK